VRAIGGIGRIGVTISNLNDQANEITTTTDADGNFTAGGIIPGDEYKVTPEGGTPTIVTPSGDGDDVGTITIAGSGVNFKTTINASDVYYAGTGTSHSFAITVTNTGDEDCTAATFELDFEDGLSGSTTAPARLGTIEPGKTKTIPVSGVSYRPIQTEYEFKKIGVRITDTINQKTWDDSVSIGFYKEPVEFNISAERGVSGVFIGPQNTYSFTNTTSESITVPWSKKDYLVVFSGATADTETIYSLGVNSTPNTGFDSFSDPGNYEPNNTEETARFMSQRQIMSYLHKNDIDYYRINRYSGIRACVNGGQWAAYGYPSNFTITLLTLLYK
jgi:hypothetical protein